MSHQPFETWIFSDIRLEQEQQMSLNAHLQECERCSNLTSALRQVSEVFTTNPPPLPEAGFTQRWYLRLARHRQQNFQQRLWLLPLGLLGSAAIILIVLLILNFNQIMWSYNLGQLIAHLSLFAARTRQVMTLFHSMTQALPLLVPFLLISGLSVLIGMIAVMSTWFSAMIHLHFPNQQGVVK